MQGDGDGWSRGPGGDKRWGRFGAAGLLLRAPSERGPVVLLQHRAFWSHHGGTWGLPGGARDSHESTAEAALREAAEEAGVRAGDVLVRAERVTSQVPHGWRYTTVVADAQQQLVTHRNGESTELRWVAEQDVAALPLHPGLAASWPMLSARPLRLFVDPATLGSSIAPHDLPTAFPRTLELPGGSFGWVRQPETDFVPDALPHTDAWCVVVTADPALRDQLHSDVQTMEPAALLGWLG